jgi:hypothetical protein
MLPADKSQEILYFDNQDDKVSAAQAILEMMKREGLH